MSERRGRAWLRTVAALLIAAAGASVAPRPSLASEPGCHRPVPQNVATTGHGGCGQCAGSSCLNLPGCAPASVALLVVPAAGLLTPAGRAPVEPEAPIVRDLASRGPPTPPPNN